MKNVKSLLSLLFICFLFFVNKTNAQLDIDKNYYANTIYLQGNKYVKNGVKKSNGFFQQNLKQEMEISPNAMIEFKKYERKRNISLLLTCGGLATILLANKAKTDSGKIEIALGGLGLALISIPISVRSANHFQKAVWLRNDDALKLGGNF